MKTLSPIHEHVKQGLTERLVFSDLVRTSLSRQEDAALLRVIVSGKDGLETVDKRQKALKEVEVREGWRVAREREILKRANDFGLVSVESKEERQKLAEQVASFTELARAQFEYKNQSRGGGGFQTGQTQGRRLSNRSPYGVLTPNATGKARPKSARPAMGSRTSIKGRGKVLSTTASNGGRSFVDLASGTTGRSASRRSGASQGIGISGSNRRVRPSSAPVTRQKTQTESRILDISQTLLKGLESHKSADGTLQAITALQINVSEAQSQLSFLMAAVKKKLGIAVSGSESSSAAMLDNNKKTSSSSSSPSDRFRMHLTKLGYFGSTKADLAIAEHQRHRHAALVIQRAARALLERKRMERKRREEEEQRKRRELEHKHDCARKIQRWYRGKVEERVQRAATLARCRDGAAARTIQRHFRYYRLIKRFKGASRDLPRRRDDPRDTSLRRNSGPIPSAWFAALIIQKWFRMHRVAKQLRQQNLEREGFLGRRRKLRSLWQAHKAFTKDTLQIQSYLVFLCFSSGREVEKVMGAVKEEEKMFSTSWLKYERKVKRKALHKPLPRNWIPHNDPVTGKIYFINRRTSEAYTTHPNLRAIAPELAMQRERASIAKYTRISVLFKYIDTIENRSSALQSQVLHQLKEHLKRST